MNISKIKIPKPILIILAFATVLNLLRVYLFETTSFLYLFWNIFLAFVPFLISSILLIKTTKQNIVGPFFIVGFVLWLLFFPNAPYVITDFIHLGRIHGVPVMFDIFVIFSSAMVSLLLGIYSLEHIEKVLSLKFSKKVTDIIIAISILFASFGMYLGRYLRFNSWDFFISHKFLLSSIWSAFTGSNSINVYTYTILFFLFIYTSYLAFKSVR